MHPTEDSHHRAKKEKEGKLVDRIEAEKFHTIVTSFVSAYLHVWPVESVFKDARLPNIFDGP